MFTRIQDRFGMASMVVAIIALIAALSGAAYAAKGGGLNGKQKKEVEKIAKKYAGKPGAPGKDGAPGAAGLAGPKGDTGAQGPAGNPGASGASVTNSGAATPAECGGAPGGGVKYTLSGNTTKICNGKEGPPGFPADELAPGASLTGTWAIGGSGSPAGLIPRTSMAFSIPLPDPLPAANVHYINSAGEEVVDLGGTKVADPANCNGTPEDPTADAGHLCIYAGFEVDVLTSNEWIFRVDTSTAGASTAGALLQAGFLAANAGAAGSWAVTAEE